MVRPCINGHPRFSTPLARDRSTKRAASSECRDHGDIARANECERREVVPAAPVVATLDIAAPQSLGVCR
jgi:hypothetical protein